MSESEIDNQALIDNKALEQGQHQQLKAQKAKTSTGLMFTVLILTFMVLASLAANGYLWQQLQLLGRGVVTELEYRVQEEKRNASISHLEQQQLSTEQALSEKNEEIKVLETDLQNLRQKIAGISGVNRIDWLVDELQHLVRLAHQRLVLSHDAQGAIALLNAADKVVVDMRLSSTLPMRQAIAADLVSLEFAAKIDLEGAYIRLDALSKKIEELGFKKLDYPGTDLIVENEQQEDFVGGDIEDKLLAAADRMVTKLRPYFFRTFRVENEIKPMLSADERAYLNRNIQLAIEEAQLALLRRESQSYLLSLEQCSKWINKHYDETDPLTVTVLKIIEELKAYRLNPEIPKIDKTLEAVDDFSDRWQKEKTAKPKIKKRLSRIGSDTMIKRPA